MDENRIPEFLCGFFNDGDLGVTFVPEAWRDGCASLRLAGGGSEKSYVDGSKIVSVPFEVRIRCDGRTIGDRLAVIALYGSISGLIDNASPGNDWEISVTSGASKSAIYDSGEEEYRGAYVLRYKK